MNRERMINQGNGIYVSNRLAMDVVRKNLMEQKQRWEIVGDYAPDGEYIGTVERVNLLGNTANPRLRIWVRFQLKTPTGGYPVELHQTLPVSVDNYYFRELVSAFEIDLEEEHFGFHVLVGKNVELKVKNNDNYCNIVKLTPHLVPNLPTTDEAVDDTEYEVMDCYEDEMVVNADCQEVVNPRRSPITTVSDARARRRKEGSTPARNPFARKRTVTSHCYNPIDEIEEIDIDDIENYDEFNDLEGWEL